MKNNSKTFKVVMLPVEKVSKNHLFLQNNTLYISHGYGNQELYIVSDEKMLISDWCIDNNVITLFNSKRSENSKKIIATTDKSLGLPLIDDSFLPIFIKSYNNGNKILEVELEMVNPIVTTNQGLGHNESITSTINRIVGDDVYLNPVENNYDVNFDIPFSKYCLEEIEKQDLNVRVKTRPNNTVIICDKKPKVYTKEEVVQLFNKFEQDRNRFYPEDAANILPLNEWLKDNI